MRRLSTQEPAGGTIKESADDFVVEEITQSGVVLEKDRTYGPGEIDDAEAAEGKFVRFILQKRDWNTVSALREITKKVGRGIKSGGFSGSKDRTAISTQLCSIYGIKKAQLSTIHVKDVSVNGAWQSDREIKLGDLLGNRFSITIRDPRDVDRIEAVNKGLNGLFPNYYGSQRFGIRDNNFDVGVAIMRGDFEKAVLTFLTDSNTETNAQAGEARERLAKDMDFRQALGYFPRHLKYERLVLEYLSMWPTDFANAIRKLPRAITLMFVHSVESRIFNQELETRLADGRLEPTEEDMVCDPDFYGFPDVSKLERGGVSGGSGKFLVGRIVGYDTKDVSTEEKKILEGYNLTTDDFRVRQMPELNCKGAYRVMFAPYKDFSYDCQKNVIKFSLPAGSYATVLLDEFVKGRDRGPAVS